jgi:hypothetical protein
MHNIKQEEWQQQQQHQLFAFSFKSFLHSQNFVYDAHFRLLHLCIFFLNFFNSLRNKNNKMLLVVTN